MHVLAFVLLTLLQPIVNDGAATPTQNTSGQQPTQSYASIDAHGISTPSTPNGQSETGEHQIPPYSVEVRKQPSPEDTPLFPWYLAATAFGVAINAFIWAAILKQTKINHRTAGAIINAERAWLMVDITQVPLYQFGYTQGNSHADIAVVCRNDGSTPCWIEEVKAGIAIINRGAKLPDVETSTTTQFTGPMPVGVCKKSDIISFTLEINDSPDIAQHVVVYGVVKYRHPFSDKAGTTTFAYASRGGAWYRLYGQSKYNDHT
jgi:hypothetical protein